MLSMGSDQLVGVAGVTGLVFLFGLGAVLATGLLWFALWVLDLPAPHAKLKTVGELPVQIRVCRKFFIGSVIFDAATIGLYGLGYLYYIYHASEFQGSDDPGRRAAWATTIAGALAAAAPVVTGILWGVSSRRWHQLQARAPDT